MKGGASGVQRMNQTLSTDFAKETYDSSLYSTRALLVQQLLHLFGALFGFIVRGLDPKNITETIEEVLEAIEDQKKGTVWIACGNYTAKKDGALKERLPEGIYKDDVASFALKDTEKRGNRFESKTVSSTFFI
ncbi:unnamed protein product [Vitrella brassicaformis CCMP3155]|uniref:Uncharacterized protein n=1 Tax=Vitrella brassicaformis (strain CCMP3155) TaxID=1169540 RepID=A0A0G4FNT3_VITBC|nr:unnamed protein product [Vitrella brassicaformis CCMP3155]|eukprot:CEM15883.1 unnamed protein product [Vitrella brassicaformis CCMP3155]